jgi:hypothetical protein
MAKKTRIMYIECKAESLNGYARIGRVSFSKSGLSIRYRDQEFFRIRGFKANYREVSSRDEYWISGPRRDGEDRLYVSNIPIEIDDDVRDEYWEQIRKRPELKHRRQT